MPKVKRCDEGKANHSQRNNKFSFKKGQISVDWRSTCNVTSYVMALKYAGWSLPSGAFDQDEDNLADFIIHSKAVDEEYKRISPYMWRMYHKALEGKCTKEEFYNAYPPTEVHALLSYGANLWMKEDVSTFSTLSIDDMKEDAKFPYVISTVFGKMNHIVCLVGYDEETKEFIIDDPWGKFIPSTNTYDCSMSGNDVRVGEDQLKSLLKPVNENGKWVHTFRRPVMIETV